MDSKVTKHRRGRGKCRERGQGLVEGVCGSIVLVTVFCLLAMLATNLFAFGVYSQKVQVIANAAAKNFNDGHYWLGARRRDWNRARAEVRGRALVDRLINELGLPPAQEVTFHGVEGPDFAYTECNVRIAGLRLPFASENIFPTLVGVSASGYSADSSYPPYAQLTVWIPPFESSTHPEGRNLSNNWRVAALPAWGFANCTGQPTEGGLSPSASGAEGGALPGGEMYHYGLVARGYGCDVKIKKFDTTTGSFVRVPF
ncbi:MAG: hypothetical protein K2X93_16850 [Candidatus Obscuribacterales bacterium]|nr:hypothetical protein [Candidatus Obscuribacterales bacterium]